LGILWVVVQVLVLLRGLVSSVKSKIGFLKTYEKQSLTTKIFHRKNGLIYNVLGDKKFLKKFSKRLKLLATAELFLLYSQRPHPNPSPLNWRRKAPNQA
jgi:hypothetical protein